MYDLLKSIDRGLVCHWDSLKGLETRILKLSTTIERVPVFIRFEKVNAHGTYI